MRYASEYAYSKSETGRLAALCAVSGWTLPIGSVSGDSLSRLVGYSDGLDLGNRDSLFFPESEASYRGREGMKAPLFPLSQATGLGGHACPYGVLR